MFSTMGCEAFMEVPCGKCVGCYMDTAMMWKVRLVHEASLYSSNMFVTLTYADEHLPLKYSLRHRDFQLFMKRLRQRVKGEDVVSTSIKWGKRKGAKLVEHRPVRFFMCGEYGGQTGRPHFHALLFNTRFRDLTPWRKDLFRSKTLEGVWTYGHSEVGIFTPGRAAYVAGYVLKKAERRVNDLIVRETGEVVERAPEYRRCSRSIGRGWYVKYGADLFPGDVAILPGGKKFKVPRYYLKLLEGENPELLEEVRRRRIKRAMEVPEVESSLERRAVREELAQRMLREHSRSL